MHLQYSAQSQNEILSPWDRIKLACQALDNESIEWNWFRILERPKIIAQKKLCLLVDSHMELFPLEKQLFTSLEKHIDIDFFPKIKSSVDSKLNFKSLEPNFKQNSSLFWAWKAKKPQSGEIHEHLQHYSKLLDLPQSQPIEKPELLRSLILCLDYHYQEKPSFHNYLRAPKAQEQMRGFQLHESPSHIAVLKLFETQYPDDFESISQILEFLDLLNPDDIKFLCDLSFFKSSRNAETFPDSNPEGLPLLTIEDFPWCASQQSYFWSDPTSLSKWCETDSAEVLARRLFPPQVESWLEAEGLSVPNPSREATNFKSLLETFKEHIQIATLKSLHTKNPSPAPTLNLEENHSKITKLSPTALEAYKQCPRRFYYQRVLRLNEKLVLDNTEMAPLQKGSWLHSALENFFKNPEWDNPLLSLQTHLKNLVSILFSEDSTAPQQELLISQSTKLALQLASHITHFEKRLEESFSILERKMEEELSFQYKEITLRGFVDRIDVFKNGVFIWDYKTGSTHKSSYKTLFSNGYFQWWVYKKIWETMNPHLPVLGGGYINPINPNHSRLFILEGAEKLALLSEELNLPYDLISPKNSVLNFEKEVWVEIDQILRAIDEGRFEASPLKDNLCARCSMKYLCGKPFLEAQA
jgi:hypothetical protein